MSRRPKFLIDECLHTTLVKIAHDRQYETYHVVHLGMGGLKDHELMAKIRAGDFTFVTNNAVDFRRRFQHEIFPDQCIRTIRCDDGSIRAFKLPLREELFIGWSLPLSWRSISPPLCIF